MRKTWYVLKEETKFIIFKFLRLGPKRLAFAIFKIFEYHFLVQSSSSYLSKVTRQKVIFSSS